ncbi:hypothetical protein J8273_3841 [Carpediemonas membranifera]|uniref:Endonuclease/exonuclease/phosphatase domain-containing protein n=1 Tax=Carpediemonas membranifera TaxID=201153 RepID=A0A8J6BCI9_9EUKA|nr:hypothetical protein J8273_3841 [Carpediemonas membranifera]|eukprot:KAG9394587.1 hypothetical protein J8273_3841 [Carpediemonas membranifera]
MHKATKFTSQFLSVGNPALKEPMNTSLRILTFNLWAPCYNRRSLNGRLESTCKESYGRRFNLICDLLKESKFDIACLQEFWFHPTSRDIFTARLGATHHMYFHQRANRADGLLTLVKKQTSTAFMDSEPGFEDVYGPETRSAHRMKEVQHSGPPISVRAVKKVFMPPNNARICLILVLEVFGQPFVVANTHLQYPGMLPDDILRFRQIRIILKELRRVILDHNLQFAPVILCGDMNGRDNDAALKQLRGQYLLRGFTLPRNLRLQPTLKIVKSHSGPGRDTVVTHCDHTGAQVGVDYIFYSRVDKRGGSSTPSTPIHTTDTTFSRRYGIQSIDETAAVEHALDSDLELGYESSFIAEEPPVLNITADMFMRASVESSSNTPSHSPRIERVGTPVRHRKSGTYGRKRGKMVLIPKKTVVLPEEVGWGVWPDGQHWSLSDHRPLMSEFDIEFR